MRETFADSEFDDCLDRDLESQISELNLDELGITQNTHFSQYTELARDTQRYPG